ncbi:hypothetical protein Tco_0193893 [Tanacetum coccineum]
MKLLLTSKRNWMKKEDKGWLEFMQQLNLLLRNNGKTSEQDKMLLDLINPLLAIMLQEAGKAKRNKPHEQAQLMKLYVELHSWDMGEHISTFTPMEAEDKEIASDLAAKSSKRPVETELDHESSKKQKTGEASGLVQEQSAEKEKRIIRRRTIETVSHIFADMLKKFDRDDLVKLWDLVKERFSTTDPTDDKEKALWVELKRLFEPKNDDTLWKLQRYMHDPLVWRLYDTCGVHHVSSVRGHDILMLLEKDYPLSKGVQMLMLANKLLVEQHLELANELLRKIFIQANRSRQ